VVRSILATLIALLANPAFAQDAPKTKWYVSADIGSAKMGLSEFTFGRPVAPQDRKSSAFRVRSGYQFVRFFALEASYTDLGSYSTRVDMDCSPAPQVQCIPDFRTDIDLQALGLFGVGMLPIGDRLTFRATVGFSARQKRTHQVPDGAPDYTRTTTALLPGFGVGAGFAATKKLDVYAEWNKYEGENGDHGFPTGEMSNPGSISEGDLAVFSMGVRWRF
jgi:opacity protein-like surface antigen